MKVQHTMKAVFAAVSAGAMLLSAAAVIPQLPVLAENAAAANTNRTNRPDESVLLFCDTFESGICSWTGRGDSTVETSGAAPYEGEKALLVKGRTDAWNGPQKELSTSDFVPGKKYSFSTVVCYETGAETQHFLLSLQYKDASGETVFSHIAEADVPVGQYVQLANSEFEIPADASSLILYVETLEGTGSFWIDEATAAAEGTKIEGPKVKKMILGDVNCDGALSAADLSMSKQYFGKTFPDRISARAADVDQSGEHDAEDISLLRDYLLTKIDKFPVAERKVNFEALAQQFGSVTPAVSYKKEDEHNPLISQYFGADPGVMEYDGRVYIFMTDDHLLYNGNSIKAIEYSSINCLRCISSDDLVNWTDHGLINAAGQGGLSKWGGNSWAPTACHKKIDGKEKFFVYFANGGNGIGVLTADSPIGPWKDPIGKALISRSTPNCGNVEWLFDPAVLVDDDGKGYLYFGGGVPGTQYAHPKTARAVQLGDDMISIVGTPVSMDPPYLFEDSGIHKFGGKYYYSYCSNFDTGGNQYGLTSGAINYMVSDNPLGPFTYVGEVFKGIGTFFGTGGNNHHTIMQFQDQFYLFYHAQYLQDNMHISGGYRSTHIDKVTVNPDGTLQPVRGTKAGIEQLKPLDPFKTVRAATFSHQGGITINGSGNTVVSAEKGDWFRVSGADCGTGAKSLTIRASSRNGCIIKVCTGGVSGTAVAYAEIPEGGSMEEITVPVQNLSGKNDLYFVFNNTANVDSWKLNE